MPLPHKLRRWFRLPGRAALILGLGALSGAAARADAPGQAHHTALGSLQLRSEGEKIFLSEGGQETELRLSPTPQRDHLLRLLDEHGPAGVKLDTDPRLIMSGGGGTGFSLRDLTSSFTGKRDQAAKTPPQVTTPSNSPKQEIAPRDRNPPADKKD
jgi:hypothetical protein